MTKKPHNLCRSCRQDFSSVKMFDAHRVGVHDYTYSEGVSMEPTREDGRRCLDPTEMKAKGWALDSRGHWCNPEASAAAREAFEELAA